MQRIQLNLHSTLCRNRMVTGHERPAPNVLLVEDYLLKTIPRMSFKVCGVCRRLRAKNNTKDVTWNTC